MGMASSYALFFLARSSSSLARRQVPLNAGIAKYRQDAKSWDSVISRLSRLAGGKAGAFRLQADRDKG
jgi:hypothetical protein